MEHKAYIFDFKEFSKELKPILEASLQSGNVDQLRAFILSNKSFLSDPYEGEALEDDWEDMIKDRDVHQFGGFAATKYYSPTQDGGMSYDWESIENIVPPGLETMFSPLLGVPLGLADEYFDPGKMGSYFQDSAQVKDSLRIIDKIESFVSENLKETLSGFRKLLEQAAGEDKGLYVTF